MAEPNEIEEPEVLDLGDRSSVRKQNRKLRRQSKEAENVIRSMLATSEQRAWWWDLLGRCGVFRADFLPADALHFATGQRNIGLLLLAAIPPDLYRLMSDEANLKGQEDADE